MTTNLTTRREFESDGEPVQVFQCGDLGTRGKALTLSRLRGRA